MQLGILQSRFAALLSVWSLGVGTANAERSWPDSAAVSSFWTSGSLTHISSISAPALKLSPELKGWQALVLYPPLLAAAAALADRPRIILVATDPDEHQYGMRLTLQCVPRTCGAIVLARF